MWSSCNCDVMWKLRIPLDLFHPCLNVSALICVDYTSTVSYFFSLVCSSLDFLQDFVRPLPSFPISPWSWSSSERGIPPLSGPGSVLNRDMSLCSGSLGGWSVWTVQCCRGGHYSVTHCFGSQCCCEYAASGNPEKRQTDAVQMCRQTEKLTEMYLFTPYLQVLVYGAILIHSV